MVGHCIHPASFLHQVPSLDSLKSTPTEYKMSSMSRNWLQTGHVIQATFDRCEYDAINQIWSKIFNGLVLPSLGINVTKNRTKMTRLLNLYVAYCVKCSIKSDLAGRWRCGGKNPKKRRKKQMYIKLHRVFLSCLVNISQTAQVSMYKRQLRT